MKVFKKGTKFRELQKQHPMDTCIHGHKIWNIVTLEHLKEINTIVRKISEHA